jgi:hypothetical protein
LRAAADARGADDLVALADALGEVSDKDDAVISGMLVAPVDLTDLRRSTCPIRTSANPGGDSPG